MASCKTRGLRAWHSHSHEAIPWTRHLALCFGSGLISWQISKQHVLLCSCHPAYVPPKGADALLFSKTFASFVNSRAVLRGRTWAGQGGEVQLSLKSRKRPPARKVSYFPTHLPPPECKHVPPRGTITWGSLSSLPLHVSAPKRVGCLYSEPQWVWQWDQHDPTRHPWGSCVTSMITELLVSKNKNHWDVRKTEWNHPRETTHSRASHVEHVGFT